MVELRREDPISFKNFMRMPPEMFDEILQRVRGRITKQYTWYRVSHALVNAGDTLETTIAT